MRGSIITVVWALSTMAVSSVSYVLTRTSGNLADCSQEHVIVNILKASLLLCTSSCFSRYLATRAGCDDLDASS